MSDTLDKPKFGMPCNGCGMCCIRRPCALAHDYLAVFEGPCPALEEDDGRYFCGLVRRPDHYLSTPEWGRELLSTIISTALGIGVGCDSDDA